MEVVTHGRLGLCPAHKGLGQHPGDSTVTHTYCPGFDLWDVPTIDGTVRVAADNADHAAFVARYQGSPTTGPAVYVSSNPAADEWKQANA